MARVEATVFSAIGEPSRLRIVELLRRGPLSVGDIVEALGLRQPQVSKHLKVLADSGLVSVHPMAKRRIYELEAEPFQEIASWVDSFEALWEQRLDALGDYLETIQESERDSS